MGTTDMGTMHTPDQRRAYRVVDGFEAELCSYTGAPFAVAVSSCTNALLLSFSWLRFNGETGPIIIPRRTYIGVLQSALNAGFSVVWNDNDFQKWGDSYDFGIKTDGIPTSCVVDAAREFTNKVFGEWQRVSTPIYLCLSFHAAKQLPIGRGGAILTDDEEAAEWFRAARMDGRAPGDVRDPVFPAFHCPMPPDVAARGLDILSRWNDRGYSPPALPHEDYPDLSQWYPGV